MPKHIMWDFTKRIHRKPVSKSEPPWNPKMFIYQASANGLKCQKSIVPHLEQNPKCQRVMTRLGFFVFPSYTTHMSFLCKSKALIIEIQYCNTIRHSHIDTVCQITKHNISLTTWDSNQINYRYLHNCLSVFKYNELSWATFPSTT